MANGTKKPRTSTNAPKSKSLLGATRAKDDMEVNGTRSNPPGPALGNTAIANTFVNVTERIRLFPALPDFGILHLSLPAAATLIVEDLERSGRHVFKAHRHANSSPASLAKAERAARTLFAKEMENRLLRAVQSKRIPCRVGLRELEDFLTRGDEVFIPQHTFIHFNDLILWLREQGYADSTEPYYLGPALRNYEWNELSLAEELERDIEKRRTPPNRPVPTGVDALLMPTSIEDTERRLEQQLAYVLKQNQLLAKEVATLQSGSSLRTNPKSVRSDLKIIAALLALCHLGPTAPGTTSKLKGKLEELLLNLDDGTIRTRMGEAARIAAIALDGR